MNAESTNRGTSPEPETEPPVERGELIRVFIEAETSPNDFRIGAEEEKFGILRPERSPVPFAGPRGVQEILCRLVRAHDWQPYRETPKSPVIALKRGDASITLEPGGQLELSGAPLADLHEVRAEKLQHLRELIPLSDELGITWHSVGFHPTARQSELPWVPKTRYPIMKRYLPTKGEAALDMMRRTATVQANYDYSSEADAMQKLVVALKLSPIIHAMLANSPFAEGASTGALSMRGNVWLHMDPTRSGLIPSLLQASSPRYDDYVEWSLDAGMFLIWRNGQALENTGQTFRDFLAHGYQGHHATLSDFRLHLSTLFPEIRLKNTLEVRPCDALPFELSLAALAVWTGLLYGPLDRASEFSERIDISTLQRARPELTARGLSATILAGVSSWTLGEEILTLAERGLARRGHGEEAYLRPLIDLVAARRTPADLLLERVRGGEDLLDATQLLAE